ncbi:MAG TPA: R3H domain-containing nucleic acid-binding protein [Edaphobacter sp.]|nr:R3H domain-containing nucleic acid-binding protein [Edaphobacter sp.]
MTSTNDASRRDEQIEKIKGFLQTLLSASGLNVEFKTLAESSTAQAPAQPSPEISVEFTGPDTPLLTARNAELLHSIEHLTAKVLRLEPEQHDRISFDAENFKALRNHELELMAQAGAERVRASGRAYAFPPMNSRERRLLHLALAATGLPTASSSDGPRRFVVAYPEGEQPIEQPVEATGPSTNDRTRAIRNSFRRR